MGKITTGILLALVACANAGSRYYNYQQEKAADADWRRKHDVWNVMRAADTNENRFLEEAELLRLGIDMGYIKQSSHPRTSSELTDLIKNSPQETLDALPDKYKNSEKLVEPSFQH